MPTVLGYYASENRTNILRHTSSRRATILSSITNGNPARISRNARTTTGMHPDRRATCVVHHHDEPASIVHNSQENKKEQASNENNNEQRTTSCLLAACPTTSPVPPRFLTDKHAKKTREQSWSALRKQACNKQPSAPVNPTASAVNPTSGLACSMQSHSIACPCQRSNPISTKSYTSARVDLDTCPCRR